MSDETDRTIKSLRDELRNANHKIEKLETLCGEYRDTITHLVEQERAQVGARPPRCGASGQFGVCRLPAGHDGAHAE